MKKLSFGDLTPEFLKELFSLTSVAQIIEACKKRELQVSEEGAGKLLEQFEKAKQLSKEDLENVAGGKRYSGTQKLFSSIMKRGAACSNDCYWDCQNDWWDACDDDCWSDCWLIYCPSHCWAFSAS